MDLKAQSTSTQVNKENKVFSTITSHSTTNLSNKINILKINFQNIMNLYQYWKYILSLKVFVIVKMNLVQHYLE